MTIQNQMAIWVFELLYLPSSPIIRRNGRPPVAIVAIRNNVARIRNNVQKRLDAEVTRQRARIDFNCGSCSLDWFDSGVAVALGIEAFVWLFALSFWSLSCLSFFAAPPFFTGPGAGVAASFLSGFSAEAGRSSV